MTHHATLGELREALREAAEVLDTAAFATSTKAGNAARARGWLDRWKHLSEVAPSITEKCRRAAREKDESR